MLIKEIMCQKRNENLVQENDMYNKIMATISFLSFIHRKYFMSEIIFITILHNKTELIWYDTDYYTFEGKIIFTHNFRFITPPYTWKTEHP